MGTVFKKTFTKPLPDGAELFVRKGERFARWKGRNGKTRTAALTVGADGSERIVETSPYFVAQYRDGSGVIRVSSTGCRDETAARRILADLERQAELIRSGVVTSAEAAVGRHNKTPLAEHLDAYQTYLESIGACKEHRTERRRQLRRLFADCGFSTLADFHREAMERWLVERTRDGMGARTRNSHLVALLAFANWCADPTVGRLASNPFRGIAKANEQADPRRLRRALNEDELTRLLAVARDRPLIDATTVRRGPRAGERYANVRPEVQERLRWLGRERALIYKTMVLTGLRKGELASLTVGAMNLGSAVPFAVLSAADEKNRQGSEIVLRPDLADDLREWIADKLKRTQSDAITSGAPIPSTLPADTSLFNVPDKLSKILNRDLKLAKISKRDDRGRVVDVHALRHTFGTLLSKGGVAPRTAQAAMRHSKIDLTMTVYTDPRLLDVAGALDALPTLPLTGQSEGESLRATGTDNVDSNVHLLAQTLAQTSDKSGKPLTFSDNPFTDERSSSLEGMVVVSAYADKRKEPLSIADNGSLILGATGLEPVTPSLSSWCSSQLS